MKTKRPTTKRYDMSTWANTPIRRRIEQLARNLCRQAGSAPDDTISIEGDYGYHVYLYPMWSKFIEPAKRRIADEEKAQASEPKDEDDA